MYYFFNLHLITSCITCCVLCSLLTGASELVEGDVDFSRQRRVFSQAETAFKYGHVDEYQQLKQNLWGYPLLLYLDYKEARDDLAQSAESTTRRFLRMYADSRLAEKLRNYWLAKLAEQERWQEFLSVAASYSLSSSLRCHKAKALLATDEKESAYALTRSLWLSGYPLPECATVFAAWEQTGQLTSDLVWQRIALSLNKDNPNLVRYLKRSLSIEDQDWVERWLRVYWDPGLVANTEDFATEHPWREAILIYGLTQLARKSPRVVPATWDKLKNLYPFSAEQRTAAQHAVASAYLRFASTEFLNQLSDIDGAIDADLQERRILIALNQGNWSQVHSRIEALPTESKTSAQWLYWQARSLQKIGQEEAAQALFAQIAQDRSYYAFLSAERSGREYYLVNEPLQISPSLLRSVAQNKTVLFVQELRTLERMADARLEWRWLTKKLDKSGLQAASRIAADWGWHDQAIFTLAKTDYWSDLNLRFPLEHKELVKKYASTHNIPLTWAFSIIRQESAFATDAASPSGALGLMQLMPATGREVYTKVISKSYPGNSVLLQPEINIALGTNYLSTVAQKFNDNLVLATAAYNAGPNRVAKWLPSKTTEADIWVENIPFQETRTYVQRVMSYMVIYEKRLNLKPSSILQRMRNIPAGRYSSSN